MSDLINLFKRHFGHTAVHTVKAPGRVELLGNHTDYNEGLVMSLAMDKHICIAAAPRSDGRIGLVSSAFPEKEEFFLSDLKKNPAAPWADYVKGVLEGLRRHGVYFGGFNAAIHGTLPLGAGMSSSAALEVATALAVRELHPYTLTETGSITPPERTREGRLPPLGSSEKLALALLCQKAENDFVGVRCGVLDQISSLFGKAFHAILIDCQHLSVDHAPMIGDIAVLICDSGVKHALAEGGYNELRERCHSAANALGVRSLRAVDGKMLAAGKHLLTTRQYQCAYHVVGENQRVIFGERALREDDFEQFGHYMFQSHESSRDFFKNSTPELDALVRLARAHPGCLGARLTGGGFGGATINLVRLNHLENFTRYMAGAYERQSGRKLAPLLCHVVDGAA